MLLMGIIASPARSRGSVCTLAVFADSAATTLDGFATKNHADSATKKRETGHDKSK
jgi:hypothetical protein